MSAKILSSFTDENPNLQKQIGCMNGIFQLFDRHHFLTSRRLSGHNNKRLLTGINHSVEPGNSRPEAKEKYQKELGKDKQRGFDEPANISLPSPSYSSISSYKQNKTAQPERPACFQNKFPQTPPRTIPEGQRYSSQQAQQSLDLRDVVKDSMHREARGLPVKIVAKEEGRVHVMKYLDSPRPSQQSKSGQPRVTGLDGSTRAFGKLWEAQGDSREKKNGYLQRAKDPPRFSYDGRESQEKMKSAMKLKDLPRFSLDSRERSLSSASESRSNSLLRDPQPKEDSRHTLSPSNELANHRRSSSLVAKLMGLEDFPEHISSNENMVARISCSPDEDPVSKLSITAEESKQNQVSWSPSTPSTSPRLKSSKLVAKQTSGSRFPLETAPWRQSDSREPAPPNKKASSAVPHASSSVYGEIEKRITELEFRRSGKDLRALKQILEAMQKTRQRLENEKTEHAVFKYETCRQCSGYSTNQDSKFLMQQDQHISHLSPNTKVINLSKKPPSSSPAMKPTKQNDKTKKSSSTVIQKADISLLKVHTRYSTYRREDSVDGQTTEVPTPRNKNFKDTSSHLGHLDKKSGRILKAPQISRQAEYQERTSEIGSPRLLQKKQGREKQSYHASPSSDLGKARKQSSRPPSESASPHRKLKARSTTLQQEDDQMSDISSATRNFSQQGDTASIQSESNNSMVSPTETEFTGTCHSNPKDRNPALRLSEDMPVAELAVATLEQPSPVSVLDAAFYMEDSPSPVKKICTIFKDDETLDPQEAESDVENCIQVSKRTNCSLEFYHKNLENIDQLVDKLRQLNSTADEPTTYRNASLCQSLNTDHEYITKILLASGLLKDINCVPNAVQLHSSGHLLNPKLFYVLEQTEESAKSTNKDGDEKIAKFDQKIRRKVIFDTVNEILLRKLSLESAFMLGRKSLSGYKLLKELHSEIDNLRPKSNSRLEVEDDEFVSILNMDVMHQPDDWSNYLAEVPSLVLDIERLIFKDLITEIIGGEAALLQDRQGRHCRQLFRK